MKIIRKNKSKRVPFDSLPVGAVFEYNNHIYEKVFSAKQGGYGVVVLGEGTFGDFWEEVEVMPLDAELIVRGDFQ